MLKEARNEQRKINSEISMWVKLWTWKSSRLPQTEKVPDWSLTGMLLTLWVITQCHGRGGTACWEKQQRVINHRSHQWWIDDVFLCHLDHSSVDFWSPGFLYAALRAILAWSPRGASVTKRFDFPGEGRTCKACRVHAATETLGELSKHGVKELMQP